MKKIIVFFLIAFFSSCNSVKLPIENKTIVVESKSNFKEKLKRYCLVQSNRLFGCQLHVNFKDKNLEKYNFSINVLNDLNQIDLYKESNSKLISTDEKEDYFIKVYSVNPKGEPKSNYFRDYKLILIYKIENDIVYLLQNDSNFDDNTTELFLLERFKELVFTIKDKKVMKNLYRTL